MNSKLFRAEVALGYIERDTYSTLDCIANPTSMCERTKSYKCYYSWRLNLFIEVCPAHENFVDTTFWEKL